MRQRVITGAILLLGMVLATLLLPPPLFATLMAILLWVAAAEWARLSGVAAWAVIVPLLAGFILLVVMQPGSLMSVLATAICLFWILVALALAALARRVVAVTAPWRALLAIPVLLPSFVLAVHLQRHNPAMLLWVVVLIGSADVLALLVGKRWGKRRLAPTLSPGKTWAGLWGGVFGAMVMGSLGAWVVLAQTGWSLIAWAAMGGIVALFGVYGDLLESWLKRQAGQKDSGSLLPGHGGVLDRIDALTAGLPALIFFLTLQGFSI